MFVHRFLLNIEKRCFSQSQKVIRSTLAVNELSNVNSTQLFQEYLQKQADLLKEYSQSDEELYMRKFELSNMRKNKCSSLSLPDGKILYSVASGSFLCFDEKERSSKYLEQLSLSFFASLFADRQGHIYNMTEDSIHSSLLMNLYSGFNRIVLNPTLLSSAAMTISLNCMQSHILEESAESLQSVQTIFYRIPTTATSIPPFPEDINQVTAIEKECGITRYYKMIEKAYRILSTSQPSKERKKQIPTESSLYMICPSLLLPYFYNHFSKAPVQFTHFCCSLLTEVEPSAKLSRKEAASAKLLLRAYIDSSDEEEGDELDEETLAEIAEIEEFEGNKEAELILEEDEDDQLQSHNNSPKPKVVFNQFPTLSIYDSSGKLTSDIENFVGEIPAYKSFE